MSDNSTATEGRVARRRKRNTEALINAARDIMMEKGVDGTTMLEIAERADVGAGTVYNYFRSKDELAIRVLEDLMHSLALRIEKVTDRFNDPARVFAYALRKVLDTATGDVRWAQMLHRSEVIADAMFRVMGPFAMRDMQQGVVDGRFQIKDVNVVWRLVTHAIIGASLTMTKGELSEKSKKEVVAKLLCMVGVNVEDAEKIANRPRPDLPPEH
jgi:AcrR family transcriptional regulator